MAHITIVIDGMGCGKATVSPDLARFELAPRGYRAAFAPRRSTEPRT